MRQPLLVAMSGPAEINLDKVNDFEAGLAVLSMVGRVFPGATFGDLERIAAGLSPSEKMDGWLTNMTKGVTKAVGNVKDGIGDVLKDTFTTVGSASGSAVRLVTDEKVIDGASRIGTAYATGGGSEGARNAISSLTGGDSGGAVDGIMNFISSLGQSAKAQPSISYGAAGGFGGLSPAMVPWAIGGVALVAVLALRR